MITDGSVCKTLINWSPPGLRVDGPGVLDPRRCLASSLQPNEVPHTCFIMYQVRKSWAVRLVDHIAGSGVQWVIAAI